MQSFTTSPIGDTTMRNYTFAALAAAGTSVEGAIEIGTANVTTHQHALSMINRPAYRDAKLDMPKPSETILAHRQAFAATLKEWIGSPEALAKLGAFITPGDEKGEGDKKYTPLMVALSIEVAPDGLEFIEPDSGTRLHTRPYYFALNVGIPKKQDKSPIVGEVPTAALSFRDFLQRTR